MLRLLNALLSLAVVVLLAVGGLAYYISGAIDAPGPLKEAKMLVVPRNDGTQQIAERLEQAGMVDDARIFLAGLYGMRFATLFSGSHPISLKAGQYEIKPGASIRSIVDTMADGRSVLIKVTVPEGLTSWQIVERIKAEPNLSGEVRELPPEGSLLPETYSVPLGSERQSLIASMQAAQKKLVDQLWAEATPGLPLKSTDEALILASIVEKETGRNDERDRVAGVFVNRLRKNMRLESDPTILYGLAKGKVQWGKTIYASDKAARNAHNTYVIPALPATPICNPGRAAIEATMKPAVTGDLFFVADGKGGHLFAANLRDHNANVQRWRQIERDKAAALTPTPAPPPGSAVPTALNANPAGAGQGNAPPSSPPSKK